MQEDFPHELFEDFPHEQLDPHVLHELHEPFKLDAFIGSEKEMKIEIVLAFFLLKIYDNNIE